MNQILENLLAIVVLLAFAGALSSFVKTAKLAKEKATSEKAKAAIDILEKIVSNSVATANQTYVDSLKEKGGFGKQEQEEIYNNVKTAVLEQLNTDTKKLLDETIANTDMFINGLIEKEVRNDKKELNK